jgi:hypothetical protein
MWLYVAYFENRPLAALGSISLALRKGISAVKFPPQLSPQCVDIIKAMTKWRLGHPAKNIDI